MKRNDHLPSSSLSQTLVVAVGGRRSIGLSDTGDPAVKPGYFSHVHSSDGYFKLLSEGIGSLDAEHPSSTTFFPSRRRRLPTRRH